MSVGLMIAITAVYVLGVGVTVYLDASNKIDMGEALVPIAMFWPSVAVAVAVVVAVFLPFVELHRFIVDIRRANERAVRQAEATEIDAKRLVSYKEEQRKLKVEAVEIAAKELQEFFAKDDDAIRSDMYSRG